VASLRESNLKRMLGQAGGADPGASGRGTHDAGPSAGYAGRVRARIKPNIVYSREGGEGNPLAEVEVRLAADGTIVGSRLVHPSGNPEWDEAVLRALTKTGQLPRDIDGHVPSMMTIAFRARD
jgi:colicin import membrane protein